MQGQARRRRAARGPRRGSHRVRRRSAAARTRTRPGALRPRRARTRPSRGRARRSRPRSAGRASRRSRAPREACELLRRDPGAQHRPPRKPMLIFWGLSSAISVLRGRLDDLGEHAAGRGGMQEGDARAADSRAGLLVDQPQPGRRERAQRLLDVVHPVGDVVQPGAALGQELPHRGLGAERLRAARRGRRRRRAAPPRRPARRPSRGARAASRARRGRAPAPRRCPRRPRRHGRSRTASGRRIPALRRRLVGLAGGGCGRVHRRSRRRPQLADARAPSGAPDARP